MKIRVAAARGSWPVWLAALLVLGWACPVGAGDDFQSWNTVEISKRLNESWEVFSYGHFRLEDEAGNKKR